jgi:hypothetical protein
MKIARLPSGELMEFPPDIPDDEMDRAVRHKMGVEEPVEFDAMVLELMQQIVALQQMLAQTMQRQDEIAAGMVQMMERIAAPRKKTMIGSNGKQYEITDEAI